MKRHLFITLLVVASQFLGNQVYAQVENYALRLSKPCRVESLEPISLEQGAQYTLQLSMRCDEWTNGGRIFECGDLIIAQSAEQGVLDIFTPGGYKHQLSHSGLSNQWSQISLVAAGDTYSIWVNGELCYSYVGEYGWSGSNREITIGGGFCGELDELRFFGVSVKPSELSHYNTLNKYHPNWDDLLLYYKFDNKDCADYIVDSSPKGVDARSVKGAVERVVNSDFKSRYMVVSGYSSFIRHNDRPNINKEMHLMTNDLIMLDAIVDGNSGNIYMQSAENGTLWQGAHFVSHLDGRDGVLKLDGSGYLSYSDNAHEDLRYLRNALNVSAWLRFDELSDRATLYRKYVSDEDSVIISLEKKSLKVSVEGRTVIFKNTPLKVAQWQHIAVDIAPSGTQTQVSLYLDNQLVESKSIKQSATINDMQAEAYIGSGVVGAMDNVVVASTSRSDFAEYMSRTSRDFRFPGGGALASVVLGAWFFDSEETLARNSASWQSKIEAIREIYSGYSGYKIRFGIITHTKDESGEKVWSKSILRPEWRATLAGDVARIAEHFDGVDIDFEWLDNNPENIAWGAYGELIIALREAIGADKVLSASLHPVSYTLPLDSTVMDCVDYITVQNYGPRHTYLNVEKYEQFFFDAVNYGIPAQKLFLSMATLFVRSDNSGVDVSGYMQLDLENITESTTEAMFRGHPYTFNSVDEVKHKMEFLREMGSNGSMYFDMGNDLEVSHPLSLIRAMNSVISSNVEILTTSPAR